MKIKYGNNYMAQHRLLFIFLSQIQVDALEKIQYIVHVTLYIDSVLYGSPVKVDRMSFGTASTVDCSIP